MSIFLPPRQHTVFCCAYLFFPLALCYNLEVLSDHGTHTEHRKVSLPQRAQESITGVFNVFESTGLLPFSIAFATTFPILLTFLLLMFFSLRLRNTRGKNRNKEKVSLCSKSLFTHSFSHSHSGRLWTATCLPACPNDFPVHQNLYCRMANWYLFRCCHTSLSKHKCIWIMPDSQQMCGL